MTIQRFVAVSVVDDHTIAVPLSPAYKRDLTIAGSIDVGTGRCRKIHAGMKAERTVNRIDAHAVARGRSFEVFIRYGLDGRNATTAFFQFFPHGNQFFQ